MNKDWGLHRPRAPLGRIYTGVCRAPSPREASEREQIEWCNWGYARGRCPSFPLESPIDAVRFTESPDGSMRCILELDYGPAVADVNDRDEVRAAQRRAYERASMRGAEG